MRHEIAVLLSGGFIDGTPTTQETERRKLRELAECCFCFMCRWSILSQLRWSILSYVSLVLPQRRDQPLAR
jgi:hypothetical protein